MNVKSDLRSTKRKNKEIRMTMKMMGSLWKTKKKGKTGKKKSTKSSTKIREINFIESETRKTLSSHQPDKS